MLLLLDILVFKVCSTSVASTTIVIVIVIEAHEGLLTHDNGTNDPHMCGKLQMDHETVAQYAKNLTLILMLYESKFMFYK